MRRIYLLIFAILLFFLGSQLWRIARLLRERSLLMKKLETPQIPKTDTLSFVLRRNETISHLLNRIPQVNNSQRQEILAAFACAGLNFRTLREGETLFLYQTKDRDEPKIMIIDYQRDWENTYRLFLSSPRIACGMVYRKRENKLEVIKGSVAASLYEAILAMGEKAELAVNFAEVLEWDIDFWTETRKGDSFIILTEKHYADGKFIRYGKILLAVYKGAIGDFYGVNFQGNYYNLEGKSLRRAFLKSPLRYSYISSHFSRSRFHPILRIFRRHRGVDYVAPAGTPVSALGEGTVTFAGWKGGYGKMVIIRHPNNYITKYGHLSRIKKGIHSGRRVAQGEVIGYVGSTGLSTGPHLHFEVMRGGSWINPLELASPPQEPVEAKLLLEFNALKDSLLSLIR